MSKDIISNKDEFVQLLLTNIEYNSSSSKKAEDYLESEEIDAEEIIAAGMEKIENLLEKYSCKKTIKKEGFAKIWKHISVQKFIEETRNPNPIEAIKSKARDLVLFAFEKGWSGPPYSPIELANFLNIDVVPTEEVFDARIIPKRSNKYQIQYNPFQRNTRINFSIAHEIAHTLFSDCAQAIRNREEQPYENRELEQLCNVAAAEIQLPYAVFSNDANSTEPTMTGLIDLAKKYNASLESVFLRYVEVIDKPCAILIGIFQDDKIIIDYHKASKQFPINLPRDFEIPKTSSVYECTSPGWTSRELNAKWDIFQNHVLNVFAAGISTYRRDKKPRVAVFIVAPNANSDEDEKGKILLEFGDATKPRGAGKKIIGQVVNTSGALGRGFGYSLAKNYPIIRKALEEWKNQKDNFKLGNTNLIKINADIYVFQMLAQKGIMAKANEVLIRYKDLRNCLVELREAALSLDASVHIPAIGAGQAKGDWEIIIGMIHDELINYGIKVNIYMLPGKPITTNKKTNLTLFKEESTWQNEKLF
ncbi:ImmA/IrrE family metallo-endopeptidase [Chryseobacterium flavum]|uniref:ImmA/IrrE family metallo-endopeptidase n=1 Tax=Chryseobacterium flavum TaxID=415851 RepID=UPI0028A663B3|nr:ImmA/IrrE family metallo-endopeptidase [Chryseobacterium flavum]